MFQTRLELTERRALRRLGELRTLAPASASERMQGRARLPDRAADDEIINQFTSIANACQIQDKQLRIAAREIARRLLGDFVHLVETALPGGDPISNKLHAMPSSRRVTVAAEPGSDFVLPGGPVHWQCRIEWLGDAPRVDTTAIADKSSVDFELTSDGEIRFLTSIRELSLQLTRFADAERAVLRQAV